MYFAAFPSGGEEAMVFIARLLLCLGLAASVLASESPSWIGKQVVAKYDYPIKAGDHVVATYGFRVYTVRRTEGDRLWVTSDSVEGWIPAKQVVLFDQAIKFYTEEIAGNPGNSRAWRSAGSSGSRSRTATRPLLITMRRSDSIPRMPRPSAAGV